ncbi:PAS domain S-box protein [Halosolutus amylolyticus]|uniref:histidine kinase n=1 Tax=Halosolutus amylolyticus TaxID=2932267 RepID=A0ABD5PVW3_9EURY|nr:PAS domain S-box protein [Halosolutus amylolyticus]
MSKRVTDSGLTVQSEGADGLGLQWHGTLADAIDGGVYHLDADDAIVAVDDRLVDMTGYDRSALLGEHASILFDARDLAEIDRRLEQVGETDADRVVERDLAFRTDGETTVPCTVRCSLLTIDGERRGTAGIVRERSDGLRDADAPRVDSPASGPDSDPTRPPGDGSVRSVLDEAEVGVFILDETFEVAWINETTEAYFGLDRAGAVGRDKRDLIEETIRTRIDDGERFAETVTATYDDNSYVERFECHVTPGEDREERWLEHLSKPIDSGPYAGGRIELYYDVTERHRHAAQLRDLNAAVREWFAGESREGIADRACRALADVLELEINGVFLADDAGNALEPAAWTDRAAATFDDLPTFEGEGVAWRVYESGEPAIYDDIRTAADAYDQETPIRGEIVLPVGDHGVVIAGSTQEGAFDENDLTLAKIAASSLGAAFDRVQHERQLERERTQTERLLQTAPIAIAVHDADGETVLANRRAEDVPGLTRWGSTDGSNRESDWRVSTADGTVLDPAETPAARVRVTGDPVTDAELAIEGPSGDRIWVSVNAAPVLDDDGAVDRVVTTADDITRLKEHERQLERRKRELESELGEVLGRVSDAFYALDEEWRFTHVNEQAEELLDYSRAALLGSNIWELFPDASPDLFDRYHEAMETQEPVSWERYSESLDIWMEIQAYPSETGLSVYFRDITERKERVRRLEVSERRYRTLAESYPGGVVVMYDEDLEYTLADGQGFANLPVSGADLEGNRPRDVFPDDTASALEATFGAALDGEKRTAEIEYADREWRVKAVPIRDDDGRVVSGMATAQDVTERKERERELATYETVVETMDDGIYALDAEGRFSTVNRAYTELTGYDRDELLGSHASLVVDETVMGEARTAATDAGVSTIETDIETRRGDRVPIEATVTRVSGADGKHERLGVVRDVTERKERQRKLEASEQRYRTLAENFPNGVVALFDDDLRFTAAGGQLVDEFGVDRDDLIGQSIAERYPDDLSAEIEPHFRAALDGEERSFEVTYRGRELLAHTLPIEPAGEDHRGMLVVQDVTERNEYRRQLEASNERLEQFAYAASHDLQEPLRMVTSYLQLIERRYGDALDEDGEEFLEFAVDGARRMREMIDGLLEYSRVETRGDPFETIDLDDVVDDVRTDLQLRIEETDAEITSESLPAVHGDGGQLRQVFQNLLSNAIEYSGDDPPRIEITAEQCGARDVPEQPGTAAGADGADWIVSVHDEGIGIDPDETDRIFEVFQRLHGHEEHDGTGIGLALCRRIVERHGGAIWVDSEPGEETTVSFTLPAARN